MKGRLARWVLLCIVFGIGADVALAVHSPTARQGGDLTGPWRITADPNGSGLTAPWYEPGRFPTAKPIDVPSEWETVLGIDYDGIAWYQRAFQVPAFQEDQIVLLRFHAAATEARVWINGIEVGTHTGPWTPFTFDITSHVTSGESAVIVVRLDEKVGHNTQGFLPIIAPHFAGLWQKVELIVTGSAHLDDTHLTIDASQIDLSTGTGRLIVSVPVLGRSESVDSVRFVLFDPDDKQVGSAVDKPESETVRWDWTGGVRFWDIGRPNLYRLEIELRDSQGKVLDAINTRVGFRQVTTQGPKVLLNGRDLVVLGVLAWGYYPPHLAPAPELERFRSQLRYFRACGFNLIKFCLWLPSRQLLEIVDQEGMLAWVEYPTWHPKIDQAHKDQLVAEYTEMSHHDGNHSCVILRSITCETGPSADLEVIQTLYDLIKARCPGTLVVDDSSWIGWNRIHDFWDDHSYGNNRTWREALASFQEHIETHGVKPLLLGEAIAADTWIDIPELMADAGSDAWWLPSWLEAQRTFEEQLRKRFGRVSYDPVADLRACALKYAMDMRRWQIETYRHQMPEAGYVVSTIRDVTLCAMGLLDNLGQPKWPVSQWSFHGDIVTPLNTPDDRRGFQAGTDVTFEPCMRVASSVDLPSETQIRWSLGRQQVSLPCDFKEGTVRIGLPLPGQVERPLPIQIKCSIVPGGKQNDVSSELWVLPNLADVPDGMLLYADRDGQLNRLFPKAGVLEPGQSVPVNTPIVATRAMSQEILDYLQAGGRVLHLTSDQSASFKAEGIWFLRGTAWAPHRQGGFSKRCPAEMLSYLQLFELGGGSIIRGEVLWDQVDPLLSFIETHDLKIVRPNLFLFETGLGRGRLIVSCLRHEGTVKTNYAGHWLARELVAHLIDGPAPVQSLTPETIRVLGENLATETMDIDPAWSFKLDRENQGVQAGFFRTDYDDSDWQVLEARSAEEGQIWARYDGWAWYRKTIAVPAQWKGRPVRIVFDSVDDMYRLYVNGKPVGGYGQIDRSESSFLKRTWVDIGPYVTFDSENVVALQVHDWVGSGGLNGKVWLTTGPADEALELLRR